MCVFGVLFKMMLLKYFNHLYILYFQTPVAKTKLKYRQYDGKLLDFSYQAVIEENIYANRAVIRYGVPVTTLKDRISDRISLSTRSGGQYPLFSKSEE